ncbi:Ldh family oxidoreductase [Candidatus Gottesmanbacteria bacterium]|nr:Ldh family oxidoreductase [Candidatus Gottesmanbacteria bacterium]
MNVAISDLKNLGLKALNKQGYTESEADTILGMLMYAQLRGNNQGMVKLIGKGIPKNAAAGTITVEKETKLSARINGGHNPGAIVIKKAMDMAVMKAKEHGIGMVGTNNTNTSTGALGYWAGQIARQGLIGFVFAGSPETVSYHGSYEPIFGTNPMAIGIPTDNDPIVLDMATAAMAYYGLIEAKTAGKKIPPEIAYDSEGNLTDDPGKAMDGALRPFDKSYKGAGLALMVEILTGPLVGASFTGIGDTATNWGNLVFVIDPEMLTDRTEFAKNVTALAARVKTTKKLPGVSDVLMPGERGDLLTKKRMSEGAIDIEDNLYHALQNAAG